MYKIEHLSFTYKNREMSSLSNINIEINKGEFLAITGHSGAGKSTLLKCLNGIIPYFQPGLLEGRVMMNGTSVQEESVAGIAEIAGTVMDDPEAQIICMDVEQEMAFGLENMGIDQAEKEKRINYALNETGMAELRFSHTAQLSGGQKQRLAIAAALALCPQVLLLDEPTSELDPAGTRDIFRLLQRLNREEKITIIIAEQKTEYLARYAGRILVLNQGRVVVEGSPGEVFSARDKLLESGVRPPQVAELIFRLGARGTDLPLTARDGARYVQSRLAGEVHC